MGELGELMKSPGGLGGAIGAAMLSAAYLFRKFQLGDKIDSASTKAQVDLIQRLNEAADRAEKRAAEAEARADLAYKERNEAYQKIGELTEQVRALKAQVETLQRSLDAKPH